MEQKDFIKIEEESLKTFVFIIIIQPYQGAEFIIKKSKLKQSFLFIINISACVKGKWKAISPPPNFKEMRKGGGNLFIIVKKPPTLKNIYFLEVSWCYYYINQVITWVYNNDEPVYIYIFFGSGVSIIKR